MATIFAVGYCTAELFDDTFTYNVVRQAGERLDTNDIRDTVSMDQFHHFAGQEPSLSGLVTNGNDRRCHFCKIS